MNNTILVTGGAGYIGSHACKALFQAGFTPVTFDNLSTGHVRLVKWGPLIQGDLNDQIALEKAFVKYNPKGVLHFAADALVIESIMNPSKYYRNNVGSTLCLLETMRKYKVPYLVFSSTCATYGNPQATLINEKHPQLPINPYGRSKLMIEQIIADFEKAYDLRAVSLRYFNAAGADLSGEIGEDHSPETHLIPSIIQAALGLRKEIIVYGKDFPTPDGSAVRDYIHVQDLAEAHVKALEYLFKEQQSASINLGTGHGCSVFNIIEMVKQICKKEVPIRIENNRPGEPGSLIADNTKAKRILDWTPQYSDLPTLIESAWEWHKR